MAFTAVTVTGTAQAASGVHYPNAVVVFYPDEKFANAGSNAAAVAAICDAVGAFSLSVSATDDAGTAPTNGAYNVMIIDPVSGEHVENFRCTVPHAVTPTTLTALKALAF